MPASLNKSQVSVLCAVALVYGITAPAWLLGGDSAEFATLMVTGGVAHPPGYPLYILWLRLVHTLFGGVLPPPHLASVASIPWGLLAVYGVSRAARAYGASEAGAALGALAFAFTPIIWRLNTQAEVFAPHLGLCALLIWFAAPNGPFNGVRRVAAIALVGGASLSVHHTAILIGPTVLFGLWCGTREAKNRASVIPMVALFGAIGLLPYLSLLHASGVLWHPINGWSDLVDHFLRRQYGTFQLTTNQEESHPLLQIWALLRRIGIDLAFVPALVGLYGLRRHWHLALSFALAGPVFAAILNMAPYGPGQLFVPRFYALPILLLCVGIAIGADWLKQRTTMAATVVAVAFLLLGYHRVHEEQRPTVDNWARNAMGVLPDDAVLLLDGDHRLFTTQYLQQVEHIKPGVRIVRHVDAATLAEELRESRRPLFLTYGKAVDAMSRVPMVPSVPLFRVLQAGSSVDLAEVSAQNHKQFSTFALEEPLLDDTPSWSTFTLVDYSEAWIWLAKRWQARGEEAQAVQCFEEIAKLAPYLAEGAVERVVTERKK